ncbi:mucin-2-like [Lineus longissimus]|uniref:mucin-2-like n=1 Tax=Lineus longissimus TaxID=88925 RepID=UPI002B4F2BFC
METRVALFAVALSLMVGLALGVKPGKPTLTVIPDPATVDAGITVKFTCAKNPSDSTDPTTWAFKIDSTPQTTGVAGAIFTYVAVLGDNSKTVTCTASDGTTPSDPSDGKTLGITALLAPILTSNITVANSKVTVKNGFPVKFTCAKNANAKQDAVSYKFYSTTGGTTTEITSSTAGAAIAAGPPAVLTLTASSSWDGKVIKCESYNTAASKIYSSVTFTLGVTLVPDAPTITFTTPLKEGAELKVKCVRSGTIATTEFEIYEGTTKLTTNLTSSTGSLKDIYTVAKVTVANQNGKKYKCGAKNSLGLSAYSTEKPLVVTGSASQLVGLSMTTMALVLVLGAVFKE